MSQPLNVVSASITPAAASGAVFTHYALGVSWNVLSAYTWGGVVIIVFSIVNLVRGERTLRGERRISNAQATHPAEIATPPTPIGDVELA